MKYSLSRGELNNWKARITKRLVEHYFEENLVPRLKKEGWDFIILTSYAWFSFQEIDNFINERVFFLYNGLLPTPKLLRSFEKLTETLENAPDGFLVKLKNTGKSKSLKTGIAEMGMKFVSYSFGAHSYSEVNNLKKLGYAIERGLSFDVDKHDQNELLPIVDGEIEVVEVKTGKSNLPPNQKRSYSKIIQEGYVLRFFHVNIISFENNEFEIEEKVITSPTELTSLPLRK